MIVLAIVLILIAVLFAAAVIIGNPQLIDVAVYPGHVVMTGATLFLTGAVTMLVLLVALLLLRTGIRRARERRAKVRSLKQAANAETGPPPSSTARTSGSREDTPPATRPGDERTSDTSRRVGDADASPDSAAHGVNGPVDGGAPRHNVADQGGEPGRRPAAT